MNGFKSRKFILATIGVVGGIVAAFVLPAFEPFVWLRGHTVGVFVAVCGLAAAYITGNALQARAYSNYNDDEGA